MDCNLLKIWYSAIIFWWISKTCYFGHTCHRFATAGMSSEYFGWVWGIQIWAAFDLSGVGGFNNLWFWGFYTGFQYERGSFSRSRWLCISHSMDWRQHTLLRIASRFQPFRAGNICDLLRSLNWQFLGRNRKHSLLDHLLWAAQWSGTVCQRNFEFQLWRSRAFEGTWKLICLQLTVDLRPRLCGAVGSNCARYKCTYYYYYYSGAS